MRDQQLPIFTTKQRLTRIPPFAPSVARFCGA
jgi:hypothetical protein